MVRASRKGYKTIRRDWVVSVRRGGGAPVRTALSSPPNISAVRTDTSAAAPGIVVPAGNIPPSSLPPRTPTAAQGCSTDTPCPPGGPSDALNSKPLPHPASHPIASVPGCSAIVPDPLPGTSLPQALILPPPQR